MSTVVNVRSQKEWDIVSKKLGYAWEKAEWSEYGENSCIRTSCSLYRNKAY